MENAELIKKIEELERRLNEKDNQQITYPLDVKSLEILNKYFPRIIDEYTYFGGAGDNSFFVMVGSQDGKKFDVAPGLIRYSVEPSTDVVTIVDKSPINRFANDMQLVLFTTDTMPTGLSGQGLTTYHVVSAASDGYSFKLSLTSGGAAVNITAMGVGRQLLSKL